MGGTAEAIGARLGDGPDERQLMRAVDALFRRGPDGGSAAIRRHRRHVRERISAVIEANPELVHRVPVEKPVCGYLGRG